MKKFLIALIILGAFTRVDAAQWLRKDTEVDIKIGCVVSSSTGVTPITTLQLTTADQAFLLINDSSPIDIAANVMASKTGPDGWYWITLSASNTSVLGTLTVQVNDTSLICPVWKDFMVVDTDVWDLFMGSTGELLTTATITTSVWAKPVTDMAAGAPSATASIFTALNWIYEAWRNRTETTGAGEVIIYKDDGTTPLTDADITDDGTDFDRLERTAPD